MPKVRLNIEISQQLADFLDGLAESENATRSEMVRRALAVLQAFHRQREIGRTHLGCVRDPQRLDAEILGILQPAAASAAIPSSFPKADVAAAAPALLKPRASEPAPLSMEAAMSRWSPHAGGRAD